MPVTAPAKPYNFSIVNSLKRRAPALGEFLGESGNSMPAKFICSGFVQYAYILI